MAETVTVKIINEVIKVVNRIEKGDRGNQGDEGPPGPAADLTAIEAQGWVEDAIGAAGASLELDAGAGSEFSATLPLTGTTTTISITNPPANQMYVVLNLITGATFDAPVWSGIDATGITLEASTAHKIALYHVVNTSGRKVVAILMHSEADA